MTKLLGVRAVYRSGDTKIYEYGADSLHSEDTNVKDQSNYAFSPVLDGGKSMPPLKQLAPYSAVVASIQVAKEESEIFFKSCTNQDYGDKDRISLKELKSACFYPD
uniref:AlNc14C624G12274 protein n=1 Tax=Albugo laibachii Nc14 TaxID=890382 RepID=F0X1I3_9STRA|nr:AlNc14C624G12274 [Albugo laibachii Nc14]|eukprot:CCA27669.1 AlNc14C624G12274 [Albugo laibachii Nc14]